MKKGTVNRTFDEIFHHDILGRVFTLALFIQFAGTFVLFVGVFILVFYIYLIMVPQLQDYVEYMGSAARVILVPSIRDANHDFVFPQVIYR